MTRYSKELAEDASIDFLEFEIRNTPDMLVLMKKRDSIPSMLVGGHLGNYDTIKDAKFAALVYWMIARPNVFGRSIFNRMTGNSGTMHDFFALKQSIQEAGYAVPEELTSYDALNQLISFEGIPLSEYWKAKRTDHAKKGENS